MIQKTATLAGAHDRLAQGLLLTMGTALAQILTLLSASLTSASVAQSSR